MTDDRTEIISALARQEDELIFTSFGHADAWRLGSSSSKASVSTSPLRPRPSIIR